MRIVVPDALRKRLGLGVCAAALAAFVVVGALGASDDSAAATATMNVR